jgi:hypothetical protein
MMICDKCEGRVDVQECRVLLIQPTRLKKGIPNLILAKWEGDLCLPCRMDKMAKIEGILGDSGQWLKKFRP